MNNRNKIVLKAIVMLMAYGVIMAAVLYILNGCMFDKWKTVTWSIFMLFGGLQSYRWYQNKIEELNDKED